MTNTQHTIDFKKVRSLIYIIWLMLISTISYSENRFTSLDIVRKQNTIKISPQISFTSSNEIKEAIDNGIRIQLIVKAHLYQPSDWWFDSTISKQMKTIEISYFILSKLYVIKNKETEEQLSFNNYDQIWLNLEKIIGFEFNIKLKQNTWVKTRIMLDKGALPTATQLPVLFDDNWDINTEWYSQQVSTGE